jgi:hypothetical protein
VRLARALNRLWGRKGQVFADRYHVRALRSPLEVRRALAYVLHNARKHGDWGRGIDPFSSGPWFDGFKRTAVSPRVGVPSSKSSPSTGPREGAKGGPDALAERLARWPRLPCRPRTWLLVVGWRRHEPIGVDERPGGGQAGDAID